MKELFGEGKRGFQYRNPDEAPDIDCPVFHIEAKAWRKAPLRAAIEQSCLTCKTDKIPIAVCKDDYKEPLVIMKYEDLKRLIREYIRGKFFTGSSNSNADHI